VHNESLRNLAFPLDWGALAEYIGFPCILKDAHGGGWKEVYVCDNVDELIRHYNNSGLLTMIVQEFIKWEEFVRCICIGRTEIRVIRYDPKARAYGRELNFLPSKVQKRVVSDARKRVRALGYDMNSIEFAIRDGVPYAIDFMNPAPDMDINSLTAPHFEWVVSAMADMAIDLALRPASRGTPGWSTFLKGRTLRSAVD
jgi:hypothetical protein